MNKLLRRETVSALNGKDLQGKRVIRFTFQGFPAEGSSVIQHRSTGRTGLWDGNRSGIQTKNPVFLFPCRHMGVTVQQKITRLKRRKPVRTENMAMGSIHPEAIDTQQGIIRHDREIKHHLVHFRIAVSTDTQQIVLPRIQQRYDFFRRVLVRQVISGSVIQQIPQKQDSVRIFQVTGVKEFAAVQGGTVNIRGNQQFQENQLLYNKGSISLFSPGKKRDAAMKTD